MVLVDSAEAYPRTVWQMLELYRYFSALGCPWVAKVDDDVYLRVPRVLGFLGEQRSAGSLALAGRDSLIWVGHMEAGANPLRTGKWKVSETAWPTAQGRYPVSQAWYPAIQSIFCHRCHRCHRCHHLAVAPPSPPLPVAVVGVLARTA